VQMGEAFVPLPQLHPSVPARGDFARGGSFLKAGFQCVSASKGKCNWFYIPILYPDIWTFGPPLAYYYKGVINLQTEV
jgi:hypothetical protein